MSNSKHAESFVLFELAGNTCAVRSKSVQAVQSAERVSPVPNVLPFVEGLAFMRGQVIPSINLRIRFGFPRIPLGPRARMLVVRCKQRTAGMLVDSAREFVFIPADAIQPAAETINGFSERYVEGVATRENRSIVILNLEEVIEGV